MDVSAALADMIRASLNNSISLGHSGTDAAAALIHALKSWKEPAPLGLAAAQPDAAGLAAADAQHVKGKPAPGTPSAGPAPGHWPNQTVQPVAEKPAQAAPVRPVNAPPAAKPAPNPAPRAPGKSPSR